MSIKRNLPDDEYQAALAANSPTAANPFATIADTGGGGGSTGHGSAYFSSYTSGNGGSGICIVRYEV